jgi:hypothetical protein
MCSTEVIDCDQLPCSCGYGAAQPKPLATSMDFILIIHFSSFWLSD